MSISVRCPKCSADYRLNDSMAGKSVRCKKCALAILVPMKEEETEMAEEIHEEADKPRPANSRDTKSAKKRNQNTSKKDPNKSSNGNPILKWSLIGGGAFVQLLFLAAGGYFLFHSRSTTATPEVPGLRTADGTLPAGKKLAIGPEVQDQIVDSDPKVKCPIGKQERLAPAKIFEVVLEGAKVYRITFTPKRFEIERCFLSIEDSAGKQLFAKQNMVHDFIPPASGDYRILAFALNKTPVEFKLKVEERGPALKIDPSMPRFEPRTQFKLTSPKKGAAMEVQSLCVSANGGIIGVSANERMPNVYSGLGRSGAVWDVNGAPKELMRAESVMSLSPDGRRVVREGKLWDYSVVDVDGGGNAMKGAGTFVRPDALQSIGTDPFRLTEFDPATGKKRFEITPADAGLGESHSVVTVIDEGREVMVGNPKLAIVKVFNVASKKVIREFTLSGSTPAAMAAKGQIQSWHGFAASPDGKWISVDISPPNGGVKVFDATNGKVVATLPVDSISFGQVFIPNKDVLLVQNIKEIGAMGAFDLKTQSFVASFVGVPAYVQRSVASADGSTLVVGCIDGSVVVWDLKGLR